MNVCVTGAAGRLGPVLCARLLEDGHHVLAVDDLSTGRLEHLSAARRHGLRFHQLDVTAGLGDVLARAETDVVCHLATSGDAPVLEACATAAVRRVVWASSAEVYGRSGLTERGAAAPVTVEGAQKAAGEAWAGYYGRARGLSVAVLRLGATTPERAADAFVRCLDGAGDARRFNIGDGLDCGAARRALGWE